MKLEIVVRFGDNDYSNTFIGALRFVADGILHRDLRKVMRGDVAVLLNQALPIAYLTHQGGSLLDDIERYLRVRPEGVWVGKPQTFEREKDCPHYGVTIDFLAGTVTSYVVYMT